MIRLAKRRAVARKLVLTVAPIFVLTALAAACAAAPPDTPVVPDIGSGGQTIAPPAPLELRAEPLSAAEAGFLAGRVRILAPDPWTTDFERRAIDLTELNIGCAPLKNCIPAIFDPRFASVADPPPYLRPDDPVVALSKDGVARAYPLTILTRNEIVNDTVAGTKIAVTFCPLCNSAIVFLRELNGRELTFGVSGFLRNSDLVMFDRETESLWQQITGEGIVGELAGERLEILPSTVISWSEFQRAFPDGETLVGPNANPLHYSILPYCDYDNPSRRSFSFFRGELDARLPATSRVLGLVAADGVATAYSWDYLRANPVTNTTIGGRNAALFFDATTASTFPVCDMEFFEAPGPLPNHGMKRLAAGSAAAFAADASGMELDFEQRDGRIFDLQTDTEWSYAGLGLSGELAGVQLEILPSGNHFWFAWAAFYPSTQLIVE